MTSDGTNTYSWDAENRLLQITYPGSNNNTQFVYDPFGRCVKIEERTSGSLTSTKQFVWCGSRRCEERDASSTLVSQFFRLGQRTSSTDYFYTLDHLGSVREMINRSSGAIAAQYKYDPYGQVTKLAGSADSDFQYAGYYLHARSGLNLTRTRAYSASIARWLSRDPLNETAGANLYGYVQNCPVLFVDPIGLLPGDVFFSPEAASIDAGMYIAPTAQIQGVEYSWSVMAVGPGKFTYTEPARYPRPWEKGYDPKYDPAGHAPNVYCPNRAARGHVHPDPNNQTYGYREIYAETSGIGRVLTPGAEALGGSGNNYSQEDKQNAINALQPNFLAAPDGDMKGYYPDVFNPGLGTGTTSTIGRWK